MIPCTLPLPLQRPGPALRHTPRVLCSAPSAGIRFFDTADSYGTGDLEGQSEKLLGQFLREYPGPASNASEVYLATKFAPYPWRTTRASIREACDASQARMGRPGADQLIGQLHWSTANYAPWQEQALWDGLGDLAAEGRVRAVGVSNYGPQQLRRVNTPRCAPPCWGSREYICLRPALNAPLLPTPGAPRARVARHPPGPRAGPVLAAVAVPGHKRAA